MAPVHQVNGIQLLRDLQGRMRDTGGSLATQIRCGRIPFKACSRQLQALKLKIKTPATTIDEMYHRFGAVCHNRPVR